MSDIFTLIKEGIVKVADLGMAIVGAWSKGKPDVTEIERMKLEYERAVANLNNAIAQAEIGLTSALMVNARWTYPLTMITGIAIVAICLFNILYRASGGVTYKVEFACTEMLFLIGMFVFVASGSIKLLLRIVEWLIEKKGGKQ